MNKTLNNIFDKAKAKELEKLVSQNEASNVSEETLSNIKNKVYAKTKLNESKNHPQNRWLRFGAMAACFLLIFGVVIAVAIMWKDDSGVISDPGSEIVLDSPPEYSTYDFEDYNDLHKALTSPLSPQYIKLRIEQKNCGKVYMQTLSDFASGEIKVAVPQLNGESIDLQNKKGFSNVTLFTNELYNLPWLWYHCLVDQQRLTVSVAYLSVLDSAELDCAKSVYQVLKIIAPNAPLPDNYTQYESYENVYEKEITLGNGKIVTAIISELKNDSEIYIRFYLEGMLIILDADKELLTEDFLRTFDVSYFE